MLLALVFALMTGCATSSPPLNSDNIREKFGSYGIEVLYDDGEVRRSSLYSGEDDDRICRTYAVVRYLPIDPNDQGQVATPAALVRSGASMGETFRDAGWQIDKQTNYIGTINVSPGDSTIASLMQLSGTASLAMHVYRFRIKKEFLYIDFAEIIEIHHPDYLTPDTLAARAGENHLQPASQADIRQWQALVLNRQ